MNGGDNTVRILSHMCIFSTMKPNLVNLGTI
jgi:hypothetical protein